MAVPVEVIDTIREGVVSIPHGWGHDSTGTTAGAAARPGVNSNLIGDPRLLAVRPGRPWSTASR